MYFFTYFPLKLEEYVVYLCPVDTKNLSKYNVALSIVQFPWTVVYKF